MGAFQFQTCGDISRARAKAARASDAPAPDLPVDLPVAVEQPATYATVATAPVTPKAPKSVVDKPKES